MNIYTPKYHTIDTDYNIREYINYMNDVLNGTIIANEYIRLAPNKGKKLNKETGKYE